MSVFQGAPKVAHDDERQLESMGIAELRKIAKSAGIAYTSKTRKAELVDLIRKAG